MRLSHAGLYLAAVMVQAGPAVAGRCLGYPDTRIVWCDDFDNYCYGGADWPGYPPPDPRCPIDDTAVANQSAFANSDPSHWTKHCAMPMLVGTTAGSIYNLPFSLEYQGQGSPNVSATGFTSQRHEWNMGASIAARYPGMNAVNGTDDNPLILRYWGWSPRGEAGYPNSPMYVELMLKDPDTPSPLDHAPTDYVMYGGGSTSCGPGRSFPIVCQQWLHDQTATPCPPLSTVVRSSLCFGWLAHLDRNPCDLENGRRPTQYHAATFDGLKWYDLRHNVFPGMGDFNHDEGGAWFQLTIKTSTYVARLESTTAGLSEGTIPRQYTGPFNHVAFGTAPGCQLNPSTGACTTAAACWTIAAENLNHGWRRTFIDTPVLVDGVLISMSGACCGTDGTCSVLDEATCIATGGRFKGISTTCENTLCCPLPFADVDHDGDVDLDDFGFFQLCYNGSGPAPTGCECLDRNADCKVNASDFTSFGACSTGPNVPWSQVISPTCNP